MAELIDDLQSALAEIASAGERLSCAIPKIKKDLERMGIVEADAASARAELEDTRKNLDTAVRALDSIETALLAALETAKKRVYDAKLGVKEKLEMLNVLRDTFSRLAPAGFEIWIPEVGAPIDPDKHIVRGKAKSEFSSAQIGDVVTWGYRFPSGKAQAAQILAGDGSMAPKDAEEEAHKPKTDKSGISMVLPKEFKSEPKKKAPAASEGLFDHLAEAAKRNVKKDE